MAGYTPRGIPGEHAAAVTDGGATETVVLTLSDVNTPGPGATVNLYGVVNITTGTSSTDVVVRVRRGTTTGGTLIGTATTDTTTAADDYTIPFAVTDTPSDEANASYVVTVTETGAAADGTVNYVSLGGVIT